MIIKEKKDWVELARVTLPLVPEYAADMNRTWDEVAAQREFDDGDYMDLWQRLQTLRFVLPDNGSIRRRPFSDICDLCSEAWALEDLEE